MTDTRQSEADRPDAALLPPVNVIEDKEGITLYADLPGVPKEKLKLQIEGELALDVPEGLEVTHAEVGLPIFRRVFTLSKELDPNKISAELANGVLTLRIPKAEYAQPRRIQINSA